MEDLLEAMSMLRTCHARLTVAVRVTLSCVFMQGLCVVCGAWHTSATGRTLLKPHPVLLC